MQKWTTWRWGDIFIHFPITPCWCDVQRKDAEVTFFFFSETTNFPCLREESRNGGETTPVQGPSLRVAQLPVMKISPVREHIDVRRCVWVAPIEPIDETHWERAYGALCHWCGGEYKVSKSSVVRTPEIYSEWTAILVGVVLVSDKCYFISRPVLMIGSIHQTYCALWWFPLEDSTQKTCHVHNKMYCVDLSFFVQTWKSLLRFDYSNQDISHDTLTV